MVRKTFMLIAGETSGDMLGAELVPHLRHKLTEIEGKPSPDRQPLLTSLEPHFFGAGGPHMAEAGVKLAVDMTRHSVVGLWEVLRKYGEFRRTFRHLMQLAIKQQPCAIICIDFSGFNLRFARAIRRHVQAAIGPFGNWDPKIIQYVSPQVWASRPGRAHWLERDCDLLLSIFPFEKDWYRQHARKLRVEFVGHPITDRYAHLPTDASRPPAAPDRPAGSAPLVVLLPGSRAGELERHLPVMLDALGKLRSARTGLRACVVLPSDRLLDLARSFGLPPEIEVQVGNVAKVLPSADLAIASTGTVTLECAYFGVPTVALYKTSWSTYQIGKRLINVKYLAMPNLLANEEILPEFIQGTATGENLSRAALQLLDDADRRATVKSKLARVIESLRGPGASERAADAILALLVNAT